LHEAASPIYQGNLGGFLQYTVEQSECDKEVKENLRCAAGGYEFEGDYEAFQLDLEIWSLENVK
jgi:hypothetical protein